MNGAQSLSKKHHLFVCSSYSVRISFAKGAVLAKKQQRKDKLGSYLVIRVSLFVVRFFVYSWIWGFGDLGMRGFGYSLTRASSFVCSSVVRVLFERPSVKQPFTEQTPKEARRKHLENVKFIDH